MKLFNASEFIRKYEKKSPNAEEWNGDDPCIVLNVDYVRGTSSSLLELF